MMWLGTVDFRVAGTNDKAAELHQLQCAVALVYLLRSTRMMTQVKTYDKTLAALVGDGPGCDSMTPFDLDAIVPDSPDVLQNYLSSSQEMLLALQTTITNRKLGQQAIAGHPFTESDAQTATPTILPTSFALLGQRFVWSAFVFSKLVYDQVFEDGQKVIRRLPSAVDAIFAMLGNDAAAIEIVKRMGATADDKGFVEFRDGVPFSTNILALRTILDAAFADVDPLTSSLSTCWLLALRELSGAPSAAQSAQVFQSREWQLRKMNTQLASLAQLRHDTLLYAKQSFTMGTRCEYSAGFVDPYPRFWKRMEQLATRCTRIQSELQLLGVDMVTSHRSFFENFAEVMSNLAAIAECQATDRPLSDEQVDFVKTVIEERHGSGGTRYLGWYPSLFLANREDSGKEDHIVADVHTDVPSIEHRDPGGILHLGVGNVHFGYFVVDKTMYAGPVFSSYEFVTPINARLTDDEFSEKLSSIEMPSWAIDSFVA
ncbi:hypothetical protein PINS_up002213 [Pythium insidiosum]|nr:hypothetical protein PINS_up002213 [Pythium insidiosum]